MATGIIVDSCKASEFAGGGKSCFLRLRKRIAEKQDIKIHVEGTLVEKEYAKIPAMVNLLAEYRRAGLVQRAQENEIKQEMEQVRSSNPAPKSNDVHVLALARVGGARVLITEDSKLIDDFTNSDIVGSPRGFVYASDSKHYAAMCKRFGMAE